MLNRIRRNMVLALTLSLAIAGCTSGCDALKKPTVETAAESETQSETASEKETETESETEDETQSETELQTDVIYVSQDKTIRITLPDSSWKVMQDVQEMRVFSSGTDAMINIVYAADADELKNITVMKSQEDLETSLARQYPESDAFEVISFEKRSTKTLDSYEYIVKYNSSTSMWAYSITYGILAKDKAYVISGTVTEDQEALLAAVQASVESFTAPGNAVFAVLPGQEEETETESETESETEGDAELASLIEYGTNATLYASADQINVRQKPGLTAAVIDTLDKGEAVIVDGETTSWFRVNLQGNTGYVSKAFLISTNPLASTEAETTAEVQSQTNAVTDATMTQAELNNQVDYGTSYTYYATAEVYMRSGPGTENSALDTIAEGSAVTVVGETDNWYVVSVNGVTGYISKAYVSSSYVAPSTPSQTETSAVETEATSEISVVSGTVSAATLSTVTIQGSDGNTYTVDYSDASMSVSGGLTIGQSITVTLDPSGTAPDGTLYATSVSGQ